MKHKTTGWYRGDQKPVRVGVYQREYAPADPLWYCYWDGWMWGVGWGTVEKAIRYQCHKSDVQGKPWRGVCNAEISCE